MISTSKDRHAMMESPGRRWQRCGPTPPEAIRGQQGQRQLMPTLGKPYLCFRRASRSSASEVAHHEPGAGRMSAVLFTRCLHTGKFSAASLGTAERPRRLICDCVAIQSPPHWRKLLGATTDRGAQLRSNQWEMSWISRSAPHHATQKVLVWC